MSRPHVLFIDNFDSFSFNLVDAFAVLGAEVEVYRNILPAERVLELARARGTALVVLSPGPGSPEEAGCCVPLVRAALGVVPLAGICLGHQAIVTALGGEVGPAGEIVHGKKSMVEHNGHRLFDGIAPRFEAGRYHSLAARRVPDELEVVARTGNHVMAVAHRRWPMFGVQFHPESILTTQGQRLLGNMLAAARAPRSAE